MEETKQAVNIFASATKKVAPTSKAKEKPSVLVMESEYEGISEKLMRLQQVRNDFDNLEAEKKMLEGEIKSLGVEKFCAMYQKDKVRPESFIMRGEKGGSMMVLPMDKYINLAEETAARLEAKYGAKIVDTLTVFTFNPVLLNKHMEAIAEAIAGANIPDEDKAGLLYQEVKHSVRKGTIDHLAEFGNVLEVFSEIAPVVQLKNAK